MAMEQTSKTWKLLILFGTLALLAGVVWGVLLLVTSAAAGAYVTPAILAVGGIVARGVGSVGRWWSNA